MMPAQMTGALYWVRAGLVCVPECHPSLKSVLDVS